MPQKPPTKSGGDFHDDEDRLECPSRRFDSLFLLVENSRSYFASLLQVFDLDGLEDSHAVVNEVYLRLATDPKLVIAITQLEESVEETGLTYILELRDGERRMWKPGNPDWFDRFPDER